jgi:hypothetical protein
MTHQPMTADEARLAAHYVSFPARRDPATEVDRLMSAMEIGADGCAPLTTALRELYSACHRDRPSSPNHQLDDLGGLDDLDDLDERTAAIELVRRLHVADAERVGEAFRVVAMRSPALRVYLRRVGYLVE